jgi:L-asparaginase II
VYAAGDPLLPIFPRSASKPMQAAGMLAAGLPLADELLALVAASHSGEPFHVDGVRRILATFGVDEAELDNTPHLPLDRDSARAIVRAGGEATHLTGDCSGKHAGMLATCAVRGWDRAGYLAPGHPLQLAIHAQVERLAQESTSATGVDGCGAPVWVITLTGLARSLRAQVLADRSDPSRRVADAMRAHPEYVGGNGRDVTAFMRAVPGLVAKEGAEGVYVGALPDGSAIAVKSADGASRAAQVAFAAALVRAGARTESVRTLAEVDVLGHGSRVGSVRATLP